MRSSLVQFGGGARPRYPIGVSDVRRPYPSSFSAGAAANGAHRYPPKDIGIFLARVSNIVDILSYLITAASMVSLHATLADRSSSEMPGAIPRGTTLLGPT